ncbi:hypothetical protein ACWPKO_22755 (plasmid) [Coraliomargarita sp. W4R53]
MILAALVLLAIGAADLVRQFVPTRRRWIGYALTSLALIIVGAGFDAGGWSIAAIAVAAAWLLTMPADGSGRGGFWPVGGVAVLCAIAIATIAPRLGAGTLGEAWVTTGAFDSVGPDSGLLLVATVTFLLESSNVIVRTALRSESSPPSEQAPVSTLKGGRLIGPLERFLVFALTLAGAYTLLAAVLAAKGIVRFPEISRDTETGARAEYFLVGSLVSWVIALACAGMVWWASGISPI